MDYVLLAPFTLKGLQFSERLSFGWRLILGRAALFAKVAVNLSSMARGIEAMISRRTPKAP